MDLLVLCPTRGRPSAAREARQSFADTIAGNDTHLLFVVDDDDPERGQYESSVPTLVLAAPGNMVKALNAGARWAIEHSKPRYIGFIGDDHRFRTPSWDTAMIGLLDERGGGMAYGNDLFWRDGQIPTQIFMSASIIEALGWMGLPTCHHLYIDNAWRVIGEEIKRLFFMPDLVIEHMHPAAGKSEWTPGHQRVNTTEMYGHDGAAFSFWAERQAAADIERVKVALGL